MSKLRGYDFFRSIGSPKRIVAPMVDQSEQAFRMLTRQHGAQLCYTPMFHSRLFVENPEYRTKMFEPPCTEDRPLIVQFCGNDPQTILAAARYVESHCDAVDLNLGCPQGIARKGRYGSFLMKEKGVVQSIVETLSTHLTIPVTVKIRIFPNVQETLEFCEMLEKAGCDLLVVHGRTKEMNKTAVQQVDWEIIKLIKERLSIPVIANGGIETYEDVDACLRVTKCDGVMTSEGILENPALLEPPRNPPLSLIDLANEYMALAAQYPPYTTKIIRAHLFKILFMDLRVHTDLRTQLARVKTWEEMQRIVTEIQERNQQTKVEYSKELSWYRRHRRGQEKIAAREKIEKQEECHLKRQKVEIDSVPIPVKSP